MRCGAAVHKGEGGTSSRSTLSLCVHLTPMARGAVDTVLPELVKASVWQSKPYPYSAHSRPKLEARFPSGRGTPTFHGLV